MKEGNVRKNDMTFKIGGEAGAGVESGGAGFAKALARGGLHVFGLQDFMSRIRGGHNFYQIRVKDEPLYTFNEPVHLLLAFDETTVHEHLEEIVEGGGIIYDSDLKIDKRVVEERGVKAFATPLVKIAKEEGGDRLMANTAGLGMFAGLTNFNLDYVSEVIEENFGRRKGGAIAEANLKVAKAAYQYAQENYAGDFPWKLEPRAMPRRMIVNGNQALSLGALAAGCKFVSGYPMTPASTILEYMASKSRKFGHVTKQVEDELAAVLMAIGASHAGVRAMTATSGGGFSLMAEALGLAGATETPLVIVEAQRGGPSTGLPTRTEQADLLFVLHASQGEFPRIVLAPGTIEQNFYTMARAFNLADKFQTPVIVMTDLLMAFSVRDIPTGALDFDAITIDRGQLLTDADLKRLPDGYKRHQFTDSGISPRALPGHPKAVYSTTGDEHVEEGFITEDADTRIKMMDKRMKKLEVAKQEMGDPYRYGPEDADITFIGWGSTYGALREAVDILNHNGTSANFLHFVDIWPMTEDRIGDILGSARYLVSVEGNYSGQFANFLRMHTGIKVNHKILRYDGRAFSPEYILRKLGQETRVRV